MMEEQLIDTLRARGQRVTPQRLAVLRALNDVGRHATADELARVTARHLPSMSRPTVYATLELFEELGLIRRLRVGGATLFDPRADAHAHLVCRECGAVLDVDADADAGRVLRAARAAGHEPEVAGIVVTGRCGGCAAAA
jgi:Fe2+ or Zn2+ uptake regulation protein